MLIQLCLKGSLLGKGFAHPPGEDLWATLLGEDGVVQIKAESFAAKLVWGNWRTFGVQFLLKLVKVLARLLRLVY